MSKIQELIKKYPNIRMDTAKIFNEGDTTPTKKYLEYLFKMWSNKSQNGCPTRKLILVDSVIIFDKLLPYIENKDIYSKEYQSYSHLLHVIDKAQTEKDENTFIKEDHIEIIEETDEYIMLIPKTHIASLKYGANTKWCTAGRNDIRTFNNYSKSGCLIYLISKKKNRSKEYNKLALYANYRTPSMSGDVYIYDEVDDSCSEAHIIKQGWNESDIVNILLKYRLEHYKRARLKNSKEEVENVLTLLSQIDIPDLKRHTTILQKDDEILDKLRENVNDFINKLNIFNDATKA